MRKKESSYQKTLNSIKISWFLLSKNKNLLSGKIENTKIMVDSGY